MKEEKEAEELEEKEKAKAKMMHGQWMQKTLDRASWRWEDQVVLTYWKSWNIKF